MSQIIVVEALVVGGVVGPFAAAQSGVVVDVWYLIADIGTVVLLAFHSLAVNKSFVLGLYACHAPGIAGLISLCPLVLMLFVDVPVGEALMWGCLPLEEGINVVLQPWILADEFIQQLFILAQLTLQVVAISQIDFALEFVQVGTLVQQRLHAPEQIIDVAHALLVSSVDELADGGFVANAAEVGVPAFLFLEAVDAEEAVAVEYEFACLFETGLTLISVVSILVHLVYANLIK